ncbi:MAG: MFS transporter [Bacteroidota bacterium]
MTNEQKLFYGSCFALITTAFSFSIRAGILPELGDQLGIDEVKLGFINSMWFWGFPISMIIGGLVYNTVGGKKIMQFAVFAHGIGILLTIFAPAFGASAYGMLLISTLLIGIGNGCTEAACNPMIADTYEGVKMSTMLNRFHMWFPGGIVLGSLISLAMQGMGWQAQVTVILIPTVIYAYLFWNVSWPSARTEEQADLSSNFSAMLSPLFIFMLVCMGLTAMSEFAPNQWVSVTLVESGAQPMVLLALTFGVMTVARYFGGAAVGQFNTTGVLLGSAVLATIGLLMLSNFTGGMAYVAAIVFGLGIAYFWPNMVGFVADYVPKSGAIGLSIIGAMGMFMSGLVQPVTGGWIKDNRAAAEAAGLTGGAADLYAGQATLSTLVLFPAILIVLFTILFFWIRSRSKTGVPANVNASMAHE